MRLVLQPQCTVLTTASAKEFARLQDTVVKEAHVVTPPIWHAGGIEIGYKESLVGGCGGPVRITALTLSSVAIVEVHLQDEIQLSTPSRCIDGIFRNMNTSFIVSLCRPCLMVITVARNRTTSVLHSHLLLKSSISSGGWGRRRSGGSRNATDKSKCQHGNQNYRMYRCKTCTTSASHCGCLSKTCK